MDKKKLWENILRQLGKELSRANLITWFASTAILNFENQVLQIGVPREIFKNWHEKNSRRKIQTAATAEFGKVVKKVEFVVDGKLENSSEILNLLEIFPANARRKLPKISVEKITGGLLSRKLNPKFQISNFIPGAENKLPHAAAEAVTKFPGEKYNPLFLFGGVGLGKTHLLHAIGNSILQNRKSNVAFVSAENLAAEFVKKVRSGEAEKMREKWRRADILIVDDVQFLAGKEKTQQFFFHLFNDLFDAQKQIIISSDQPPAKLDGMEKRLVSRFSMGMICELVFPDFETRVEILHQKMKEFGAILPARILNLIAQSSQRSVRELEGILTQTVAQIDLTGETPRDENIVEIAQKVNRNLRIETKNAAELTATARSAKEVCEIICDFFSISFEEIVGSNRSREFLQPRQIAIWFCKKKLKMPLKKIGVFFGGRDHSTILNSIARVEKLRKTDAVFWRTVNNLRRKMGF